MNTQNNLGQVSVGLDGNVHIGLGSGLTVDSKGDIGMQIGSGLSMNLGNGELRQQVGPNTHLNLSTGELDQRTGTGYSTANFSALDAIRASAKRLFDR